MGVGVFHKWIWRVTLYVNAPLDLLVQRALSLKRTYVNLGTSFFITVTKIVFRGGECLYTGGQLAVVLCDFPTLRPLQVLLGMLPWGFPLTEA